MSRFSIAGCLSMGVIGTIFGVTGGVVHLSTMGFVLGFAVLAVGAVTMGALMAKRDLSRRDHRS